MVEVYAREGGDITAADMVIPDEDPSKIVEFFTNSTVFLTGATGYLGKLFLEKLLRSCPNLRRIYILVRPKKGKETQKRFEELFDGPCMDLLKRTNPNYLQKVTMINGDCSLPDVGMSNDDKELLINEVNVVIHCAATVRFDAKIRNAAYINVRSVKDLLKIAKQAKNLKSFLYISTAFSNCTLKTVDERFYNATISPDKLLTLVEVLDEDKLEKITPVLLGEWPNSYVFTKAVAENAIRDEAGDLPIAVFRPSIVIATVKEPVSGWIDNLYGATGVLVGAALGLIRSLHGKRENLAEMVPADFVINSALAAAWDVASTRSLNENLEIHEEDKMQKEVPIYNYVSSCEAPITWDRFTSLAELHAPKCATELQVWKYNFALRSNLYHHLIAIFILHTIPSYFVDFLALCVGKKPMMVEGYRKINKFCEVIGYFSSREWNFKNDNVRALWKKLEPQDQKVFEFSLASFDWEAYFKTYIKGARVYLLKDPLDTIPKGRIKHYKLNVAHYVLMAFLYVLLYKFLRYLVFVIFEI